MQKLLRAFFVILLLFAGMSIALAEEPNSSDFSGVDGFYQEQEQSDDADLRIIPDDGVVGETFTILVSDLNANEEVTIRIIFVETDTEVYSSTRTADSSGRLEVEIFTESSDTPGTYRIELLNGDDDVIAEDELILEEAAGREGLVNVSPAEAVAGSTFTIEISEVAPFADLLIIVTNEAGDEVYRTGIRATADGTASVSFNSSADNVGNLNIQVLQNETIPVASGSFVVQEEEFPATVVLDPASAMPNDEVFVTVSGLEPEAAVTIRISNDSAVLLSQDVTANINGLVTFSFIVLPEMALGDYRVEVLQGDTVVARTQWSIDIPSPDVTVSPTVAVPSSSFLVEVNGLQPGEQVVVDLLQGETVLQTFTITGDADGYARAVLGQRLRLAEGEYVVRLMRAGHEVFTQTVTIVAEREAPETTEINPADVTLTVSPESGVVPTEYVVTIEGLPPDTDLNFSLLFDGQQVLTFQGTSDANGVYTTTLTSEASDPIGTYTLEVRVAGQLIATADFAIVDEEAEPTDEPEVQETPVPSGDVTVRIEPQTVHQGERFEIFVTNLEAGETVTIELRLGDEVVYSSQQTANAEGAVAIALTSDADDALGSYELVVLRAGEEIASSTIEIVASDTSIDTVELSISPESAPQGASHTITVSGLEAGETVTIVVTFDGEEVFRAEREADSQGLVTVVLNTGADDAIGEYNVAVTHANGGLIGSFTVTEGDSTTEPSGELEMTIEPSSGEIGTVHTATVTGLDANEDVSVRVEYDGEVVYETSGTADEDGVYTIALATGEGDEPGSYTIVVVRESGEEISGSFTAQGDEVSVEPSGDFTVVVSPDAVTADENFEIVVTGLEANETVAIVIFFDGEIVYQSSREADGNGELTVSLALEEDDPSGTYTIEVQRNNGDVATAELEVQLENAQTSGDDVSIEVEPQSGEIGTRHIFTITGLDAGETVTIVVELDGEEVFTTEATANPNGVAEVGLTSEEGDEAGEYDFIVQRDNGDEFSTTFTIEGEEGDEDDDDGGDEQETSGGEITLGDETYTGVLTEDEPEVLFTFEGEEGQGVEIHLNSEQFDAYLQLLDENGDEIAYNDDSGGSLNSTIIVRLPYSGEYTIVATSLANVVGAEPGTGRFTLTAQAIEIEEAIVELDEGNQFITENLSVSRPEVHFVFEGEEGETLLLSVDSSMFDTYLLLYDEDGRELARNDDSNGTLNSQIGPIELPEDGTYTAVVTSYYYFNYGENVSGEFNFRLETVSITETAYGETLQLAINAESASQFIEFDASAGDVISVTVNSNGSIDTILTLLDPTGYALDIDDDGGEGFDPEIERFVLPSDGTYILMLRAFTVGDVGDVELQVNLVDEQNLDSGTSTIRLNSKQSYDILVFEGVAGETVDLVITIEGGSVGAFSVYAEQADYTLLNYQSFGMRDSITLSFRVPADGMVRIIIQDNSGSNVVLNVELIR